MSDLFEICGCDTAKCLNADFRIQRNGEVLLMYADNDFLKLKMMSFDTGKKYIVPLELSERLKKYFIHLATGESFCFLERISRLDNDIYRITGYADNNLLHISAVKINDDYNELYTESSRYTSYTTTALCLFSCRNENNMLLSRTNKCFHELSDDYPDLIFNITHSRIFLYASEEQHSSCGEIEFSSSNGKKCKFVISCLPLISCGRTEMIYVTLMRIDKRFYSGSSRLDKLTPREREITLMAAEGYTNRYIAEQLNISEGTVKKNLYNSYKKLRINSRFDAAKMI